MNALLRGCLLMMATSVSALAQNRVENPIAEFAGLDKITGRIIKFEVKLNETVQFGALQVTPRACFTRAVTDQPQTTGFVEVEEITLKNEVKRIFNGWMFAASPGLNAVEHAIYDVWLTDCKGTAIALPAPGVQPGYQGDVEPSASPAALPSPGAPPTPRRQVPIGQPPGSPLAGPAESQPAPQNPIPPSQPARPRAPVIQPGVPFDPNQLPPRR
ncbi:MAG: DUF2155 domain-containing protein [Hyphomicrobiales bacterium]|nr:DUF2155 domain-containing protein [Hyphomicrobiales bacterium]